MSLRFNVAMSPLSWLLTLCLGLLGTACTPPEAPPQHLVLITVDTLRADHLGCYGYARDTSPVLDALAAESTLFERAFAQWPKTGPSFASLFIGQYPHTTGLTHKAAQRVPETYLTLPELMHRAGFTTLAVTSNGVLAKHLGWQRGFDEYLQTWDLAPEQSDDPNEYRRWINARRVNELALPMIERHGDAEKLFIWLHYSDPHAPYVLPSDFENPFVGDALYVGDAQVELENPRATALPGHRDLKHYVAAYDANVRVADQEIGRAIETLRQQGIWDRALVVMTADHGESLGEHDYFFGHGRLPHNPGSHVPLMISQPSQRRQGVGRRIAEAVELVDVYPTLRQLLVPSMEVPGLEGRSLVPMLALASAGPSAGKAGDAATASVETSKQAADKGQQRHQGLAFSSAGGGSPLTHFRSVQNERFKLVFHPAFKTRNGERPELWQLFDLVADPGEENDLLAAEPLTAEHEKALRLLRRQLVDWMAGRLWIRPPKEQIEAHNEEMEKTLRALGYIQ